jgi:hypothetical protein
MMEPEVRAELTARILQMIETAPGPIDAVALHPDGWPGSGSTVGGEFLIHGVPVVWDDTIVSEEGCYLVLPEAAPAAPMPREQPTVDARHWSQADQDAQDFIDAEREARTQEREDRFAFEAKLAEDRAAQARMRAAGDSGRDLPVVTGSGRNMAEAIADATAQVAARPAVRGSMPRSSIGVLRIQAERERQQLIEGWTPEHDADHTGGELARAGACYAEAARVVAHTPEPAVLEYLRSNPPAGWPWHPSWWKPDSSPVRNLEKAGALIAAEIDRLTS